MAHWRRISANRMAFLRPKLTRSLLITGPAVRVEAPTWEWGLEQRVAADGAADGAGSAADEVGKAEVDTAAKEEAAFEGRYLEAVKVATRGAAAVSEAGVEAAMGLLGAISSLSCKASAVASR